MPPYVMDPSDAILTDSAGSPSSPDWSAQADELACPMCGYNLRGLAEPRCPECGYAFEWAELIRATRDAHPYLFEHHYTVGRFVRTSWEATIRPRRFWTALSAAYPICASGLRLFLIVHVILAVVLTTVSTTAVALVAMSLVFQQAVTAGNVSWFLGRSVPPPLGGMLLFILAWPMLTWTSLQVFLWTMMRMNIAPAHVTRCVTYAGVIWAWFVPLAIVLSFPTILLGRPVSIYSLLFWILIAGWAMAFYRLGIAYRQYMRFPHAWATVVASQVMTGLAYLCVLVHFGL
jgi:hypothetical protein